MVGQLGHCVRESKLSGSSISPAKSTLQARRGKSCYKNSSVTTGLGAQVSPTSSEGDLEEKSSCCLLTEGEQILLKASDQVSSSSVFFSSKEYKLHNWSNIWRDGDWMFQPCAILCLTPSKMSRKLHPGESQLAACQGRPSCTPDTPGASTQVFTGLSSSSHLSGSLGPPKKVPQSCFT